MAEQMLDDEERLEASDSIEGDGEQVKRGRSGRRTADRVNQTLVIVVLLVLIAALAVGVVLVRRITTPQAPTTIAEADIADLQAQIVADPSDPNLRLSLIEAYYRAKNYDEAQAEIDDLYSQEITGTVLAVTMYADARIEEARGNDDEAIDLYLQCLDIMEYTDSRYAVAALYASREEWEKAIEHYTIYLEYVPYDAGVLLDIGEAYEQVGETEKALESYNRALQYLPDDPEILAAIDGLEGR